MFITGKSVFIAAIYLAARALKWSVSTIGLLTCPCALVTSCPVAPCRFDKVFPNTCDPAMDPMAAAAATWLASGFSCWGQRNH